MSGTEAGGSANCREIRFATGVFAVEAIKRAAYTISDRARVEIEPTSEYVICRLHPLRAVTDQDLLALENAFSLDVLDQDLRRTISEETAGIRNLILSIAFSKTDAVK